MLITVFTPTYNRGHLLRGCFESLLQQQGDFEWLVIDDGSTDETQEKVADMAGTSPFPIRYYRQENAGKQSAWNTGVNLARGRYFIGLDSDDELIQGSLSQALDQFQNQLDSDSAIIGVRACSVRTSDGERDGKPFCPDGAVCSWFEELGHPGSIGERIDIFKTFKLKEFFYPVEPGLKFIPEIWFYVRLSSKGYLFLYTDLPVRKFSDDHNHLRLSRTSLDQHARGHLIARQEVLRNVPWKIWIHNPFGLLKSVVRWGQARGACGVSPIDFSALSGWRRVYFALALPIQVLTQKESL